MPSPLRNKIISVFGAFTDHWSVPIYLNYLFDNFENSPLICQKYVTLFIIDKVVNSYVHHAVNIFPADGLAPGTSMTKLFWLHTICMKCGRVLPKENCNWLKNTNRTHEWLMGVAIDEFLMICHKLLIWRATSISRWTHPMSVTHDSCMVCVTKKSVFLAIIYEHRC